MFNSIAAKWDCWKCLAKSGIWLFWWLFSNAFKQLFHSVNWRALSDTAKGLQAYVFDRPFIRG